MSSPRITIYKSPWNEGFDVYVPPTITLEGLAEVQQAFAKLDVERVRELTHEKSNSTRAILTYGEGAWLE